MAILRSDGLRYEAVPPPAWELVSYSSSKLMNICCRNVDSVCLQYNEDYIQDKQSCGDPMLHPGTLWSPNVQMLILVVGLGLG